MWKKADCGRLVRAGGSGRVYRQGWEVEGSYAIQKIDQKEKEGQVKWVWYKSTNASNQRQQGTCTHEDGNTLQGLGGVGGGWWIGGGAEEVWGMQVGESKGLGQRGGGI